MSASATHRRDFFVSFHSADRAWAEWIAVELEAAGKTVFFQHWDFDPGSNFILEMHKAAECSDRTIAVLSPGYLEAIFTRPEWAAALLADPTGAQRKLLPVRVAPCTPSGLLAAIVYVDLAGCSEQDARTRLRAAVQGGRDKPESVRFPGQPAAGGAFPGTSSVPQSGPKPPAGQSATGQQVRNRAVRLLETFFEHDGEQQRRTVFGLAFGECERSPLGQIEFRGACADFAGAATDRLLAFGCAGRGRHALSLLLATMAEVRGRQSDADFHELPRLLDTECSLPTRDEELRYLRNLKTKIEFSASQYSALRAIGRTKVAPRLPHALKHDPSIAVLVRHRTARMHTSVEQREARDYDDILPAFAEVRRAALLGEPGSGKSTTLRKVALDLAVRALDDPQAPLPLLAALGVWTGGESLAQFLANQAPEIGWALEGLSRRGRLVLLLDGLNEVPTSARSAKAAEISKLLEQVRERNTSVIVSCRAGDYRGELDLGLDSLTLEPLCPRRIQAALRHWVTGSGGEEQVADQLFWQLAGDERLAGVLERWRAAGGSEESFWSGERPRDEWDFASKVGWEQYRLWRRHLTDPRNLLRLAANPFLLFMLYVVWRSDAERLPKNRGDLFRQFIDQLLARDRLLGTPEGSGLLSGLADLAWQMQRVRIDAGQADSGDFGVLTAVSRAGATAALGGATLLAKALDCTLLERDGEIRFRHQLLQEYFTAQALQQRLTNTAAAELWPPDRWWRRSGWEVTAVLLAGFHSDDCTPVIRWLAGAQPEVAAQCIVESGAAIAQEAELKRELQMAWLPLVTDDEREPRPEARAALGRALGRLDLDNRKGVGVRPDGVPDIDWVQIPGGTFVYQEGERRTVETFHMARYPVTNAQFRAFLKAEDGYRDDRWWKGLTDPDRNSQEPEWSEPNHPRETVSWYEAMAFCAWLTYKMDFPVRLPTEWEWERAAGGMDGQMYPWGGAYRAGHANIPPKLGDVGPHYLGCTSPVGMYAKGASPEGVHDLAGNVWEWCLNEHERPKRAQSGGTEPRVLRGGSWGHNRDYARASDRPHSHPDFRGTDVGFRVVCSSPSAGH